MKTVPLISAIEAARKVKSGDVLVVGGFGMTGTPIHLLDAIAETDIDDLTMIANNIGEPGLGGGRMLRNGQIRKAVGSYYTSNREAVEAYLSGEIEIELLPQGQPGRGDPRGRGRASAGSTRPPPPGRRWPRGATPASSAASNKSSSRP